MACLLLVMGLTHPVQATESMMEEDTEQELGSSATSPSTESSAGADAGDKPGQADAQPLADAGQTDPAIAATATVAAQDEDTKEAIRTSIRILGREIKPGQHRQLKWNPSGYAGLALQTPVEVVHGEDPGPVLCLTAAVHGDELNGVEIVRRIVHELDPLDLQGTVIAVPIVNLQGFLRNSRYLPDRRDLNRNFPGNPRGSSARRIAHSLFEGVIRHCDALVDLHTGSFHRANLPQLRADLDKPAVLQLTRGFGSMVVLHVSAGRGTLRGAATAIGIPAVTLEAGAPLHLDEDAVVAGVEALQELLNHMQLVPRFRLWSDPQPLYYRSIWVRPMQGGILFSAVNLGDSISKGDLLGTVTDPVQNKAQEIIAPVDGRILGKAMNQMVMPGFAAFHLGVEEGSARRPVAKPEQEDEAHQEAGKEPETETETDIMSSEAADTAAETEPVTAFAEDGQAEADVAEDAEAEDEELEEEELDDASE